VIGVDDVRQGVTLTNLDQPLFDAAGVTKRDLIDYLDAMADRIVPVLSGRPLSVIRVRPGQAPFMQKNKPKGAPDWLPTVTWWAESSQRDVSYVLCEDRRTLLWFGNQRAVEYHPTLVRADRPDHMTHLVLDLDPPEGTSFADVVNVAHVVRDVLERCGLQGVPKTSGAKGVHIYVPIKDLSLHDSAAALRALARRVEHADPSIATTAFIKDDRGNKVFVDATRTGGATVAAAYSPRIRPGCPVSFPVAWSDLDSVMPADFTVSTALRALGDRDPWASMMPEAQSIPQELIDEGDTIPVARIQAMHEGKRRAARARKA
jgi:DNA ligase D-like protein (predicted polymerase)